MAAHQEQAFPSVHRIIPRLYTGYGKIRVVHRAGVVHSIVGARGRTLAPPLDGAPIFLRKKPERTPRAAPGGRRSKRPDWTRRPDDRGQGARVRPDPDRARPSCVPKEARKKEARSSRPTRAVVRGVAAGPVAHEAAVWRKSCCKSVACQRSGDAARRDDGRGPVRAVPRSLACSGRVGQGLAPIRAFRLDAVYRLDVVYKRRGF